MRVGGEQRCAVSVGSGMENAAALRVKDECGRGRVNPDHCTGALARKTFNLLHPTYLTCIREFPAVPNSENEPNPFYRHQTCLENILSSFQTEVANSAAHVYLHLWSGDFSGADAQTIQENFAGMVCWGTGAKHLCSQTLQEESAGCCSLPA